MQNFIIIISFITLGFFAQRFISDCQTVTDKLNRLVVNIIIPAVIFLNAKNIPFDKSLLTATVAPWLVISITSICILVIAKWQDWERRTIGATLLMASLGNTSFLGFPMVESLLGADHLIYAIIYDQVGNFLALAIFGTFVINFYSDRVSETWQQQLKQTLFKIIKFPPFLSLITALALNQSDSNVLSIEWVEQGLFAIALLLTPCTMFIIGINFTLSIENQHRQAFITGLAFKLLIAPCFMYLLLLTQTDDNTMMRNTLILESGMPPMVTAAALAMSANLERKLCAAFVATGLILSLISLPMIALLIQQL